MKEKEQKIVIRWSIRKTLTAICGVFFIPALVIFFVSLILQQTIINPAYYKSNFKKIDAYERMINQGIPSLILKTHISDNPLTDTVAKDITTLLLQKFVDPMWLEAATEKFIDATIDYLTNKSTKIELNLTDAREYLNRASSGLLVVREFIPTCTELKDDKELSIFCSDKTMNPDEVIKDIDAIRKEIDAVNLEAVKIDDVVNLINADMGAVRMLARDIKIYLTVSLIILILSVMGVVILQSQRFLITVRSLAFFTGVGSFLTLLLGLIAHQFVPNTINLGKTIILSPSIRAIIEDFLDVSISGVMDRLELVTFITLAASFLLFAFTYFKRK